MKFLVSLILPLSLSARRAWIEIFGGAFGRRLAAVALRKESVDRNNISANNHIRVRESLSARRAWIEISTVIVILRKRNSRSPQGERG